MERQLARLPDGSADLARAVAVLGGSAPVRHAAHLARLDPRGRRDVGGRAARGGAARGDRELSLTHPLVAGALRASFGAGELAQWHGRAASMLAAEGADPERVALHVLRTDPAADPETVALLRAAAERARGRGAPESAAAFLRRALAEPPVAPAIAADVRLELGLALAAHVLPDAGRLLLEAVELAASPEQRVAIALRGGRAPGMAGHFEEALELCRRGLEDASEVAPEAVELLEAELVCVASVQAAFMARRAHGSPIPPSRRRPSSGGRTRPCTPCSVAGNRPPTRSRSCARCSRATGSAGEPDSLLNTVAMLVLIQGDELEVACASCTALIELARPRGWLIALAPRSFLRAIALVRAGRVREAEADARLSFEFKLRHSALHALLWSLYPLVDALTETDQPESADAALAAAGVGDPPEGALTSPLLLQSRARLRLSQHRPDEALADLLDAGERWAPFGHAHPGFASWHADAAEALVALGEPAEARRHAETHLQLAEQLGLPGPIGAGLRAVARTADRGERSRCSNAPPAVLADSPAQLEQTRVLVDLGARCGAPTAGPTRATRCAGRSTSPSATACGCSPAARATSCTPRAPARAGPRSRARTR